VLAHRSQVSSGVTPALLRLDPLWDPLRSEPAFPKTLRGKAAVNPLRVKDWEIVADNLSNAGWSWGCVSALNSDGRTIWIADAPSMNSIQK